MIINQPIELKITARDRSNHEMAIKLANIHRNDPYISNAQEKIARMKQYKSIPEFQRASDNFMRLRLELISSGEKVDMYDSDLFSQYNYHDLMQCLSSYLNINTVLNRFFPNDRLRGKKILQLAPAYGVNLHLLKNRFGVLSFGIEKDPYFTKYARKYGHLSFMCANANNIPFQDNYFDAIISRNFLDIAYLLPMLNSSPRTNVDPLNFIESVISSAWNKLKPGGIFISQEEDLKYLRSPVKIFKHYFRFSLVPDGLDPPVDILIK